jgi:predicted MFS family arabinose efflux permease
VLYTYAALFMSRELFNTGTPRWWIAAAGVIAAMMAIQMASLGFSPLLPAMTRDLGASYSQMGLFTGMYGIVALCVSLPAGMLAARIGEKRTMLAGLAVTGIGLVSLGNSSSYPLALASRTLWLVGYRIAFIAVFTSMAIVTPAQYRSRTMGILGALAAFASVIGAPFGTRLAGSLGWRNGIFGYAAIAVIGAVLFTMLYRRPDSNGSTDGEANRHAPTAASASALRNPVIWGMILLGLINMGGFSVTFFVPYAVRTVFGLNVTEAAQIISTSYLVSMVLNLGFGWLCDRYSRWNMMIALAILLIPASLAVMSKDLLVFRTAVALIVSLGHAATNQLYAISGTLLPKDEVGKGIGLMGLGSGIFGYIGPQMLGYLRDATGGFTAGWIFVACAAVLSLMDLLILRAYSLRASARAGATA